MSLVCELLVWFINRWLVESCCLGQNKDGDAKRTSKSRTFFSFFLNNSLVNSFSLL